MTNATEMPLEQRLFNKLSAGAPCSGQHLADELGVTRSAVWKAVERLRQLGLPVRAQRPAGYRLSAGLSPLDAQHITRLLPAKLAKVVRPLNVAWSLDSTNSELLRRTGLQPGRCEVLLAECQLAGRGRRARSWLSAPGSSLCLSLGWQFPSLPSESGALSLAIGVAVLRALRGLQDIPLQLKWPNDVLVNGRKLGGILIELRAEAAGPAYVVVGIGLNVSLPDDIRGKVRDSGTRTVDLHELVPGITDRNQLAAHVIAEVIECLQRFGDTGFKSFRDEWLRHDALAGQPVRVYGAGPQHFGLADGVDADGALRLRVGDDVIRVVTGEVSLRAVP